MRRHVTSKKALVVTNDRVGPLYLDKIVKVWQVVMVQMVVRLPQNGRSLMCYDKQHVAIFCRSVVQHLRIAANTRITLNTECYDSAVPLLVLSPVCFVRMLHI